MPSHIASPSSVHSQHFTAIPSRWEVRLLSFGTKGLTFFANSFIGVWLLLHFADGDIVRSFGFEEMSNTPNTAVQTEVAVCVFVCGIRSYG